MKKMIILGMALFLTCIFAAYTYAEITINPDKAGLKVVYGKEKVILNSENSQTTVTDTSGGTAEVAYDAVTGGVTVNAIKGSSAFSYGIAKIYIDGGESAQLTAKGEFRIIDIAAAKGEIIVIFPNGSKIVMPERAVVQLVMRAGGNYYLSVTAGGVQYTAFDGNRRTLTAGNAPVLVQGFGF